MPTNKSALPSGVASHTPGDCKEVVGVGTIGSAETYATGGFTVTPASYGLNQIYYFAPVLFSTGHWGFYTGSKLKVFSAAGTELANASTALENATFNIHIVGI